MSELAFHPIAEMFPLMEGAEFDALVADIAEHGQREPITLYEGMILDGRNRYRACMTLGLKPETCEYTGDDPKAFVVSLNLHRRHLNESQRAMCAARLANMQVGRHWADSNSANWQNNDVSRSEAACLFHVSERSVNRAAKVQDKAELEVVKAVDDGILPVSAAANLTNTPADFQREVVGAVASGTRPQEAVRQAKARRVPNQPNSPTGKYRVLYADPPWSYGNTQPDYHPEQRDHYPVMSLSELCTLPVKAMSEDDAVLFLWATSPILEDSFKVIRSWGFTYKASFVWDKIKHNMGHYNSVRHEFLLVCVRGSCQPDERTLFDSVQSIERTEHSVKPEQFRTIIDTLYPFGDRIELFARHPAEGWHTWGNQV